MLGNAAAAPDLSDLFLPVPRFVAADRTPNGFRLTATNVCLGRTNYLLASPQLVGPTWSIVATNVATNGLLTLLDATAVTGPARFYRIAQQP